jgi:hypothetical protein
VVRSKIGQPSKNPARRKSDWELGLCHQIISAITIVMLASIGIVIVSIVYSDDNHGGSSCGTHRSTVF